MPPALEISHALAPQKCFHFHSPCEQSSHCRSAWHLQWCWKLPLCLGTQSFLEWVVSSLPLLEVSLLLLFPLGTQLIALPQTTASLDVSWAESSLLIHAVIKMHRVCDGNVHRQSHVGQSAAWRIVICLPTFSQQNKLFFFCKTLQVSSQVANLCQLMGLLVGRLTSGCSEQLMVVLITECSCPLAIDPTLGNRIWLSLMLPLL